jgi:hypothetical protein
MPHEVPTNLRELGGQQDSGMKCLQDVLQDVRQDVLQDVLQLQGQRFRAVRHLSPTCHMPATGNQCVLVR